MNKKTRTVLFVLDSFPPQLGGRETLFSHLASSLAESGYKVIVVTFASLGSKTIESRRNLKIIRVKTSTFIVAKLFAVFPPAFRFSARASIIHTTPYYAMVAAWFSARLRMKPCVLTVHEVFGSQFWRWTEISCFHRAVFFMAERALFSLRFTRYICDSAYTKGRLLGLTKISPEVTRIIYPPVENISTQEIKITQKLRPQLKLPVGSFVYCYFGRPGVTKGLKYLCAAAQLVAKELPGSHLFLLLAKEPAVHRETILKYIEKLELLNHTTIWDSLPRKQLLEVLLEIDCVVVPSLSEGFGYAAVEATLLGCSVVATSGHAVQEILSGRAIFVPPRDSRALARAISSVATNSRDSRPWHLPNSLSKESVVKETTKLYESIAL